MHGYAAGPRTWVSVVLVIIAIVVGWLVDLLAQSTGLVIPWFIGAPSVLGAYGTLWFLTDRAIWKSHAFRSLFPATAPDLSGDWVVVVRSSTDGHVSEYRGQGRIKQTWTQIAVQIDFERSTSFSVASSFVVPRGGTDARLVYLFDNHPKGDAPPLMERHGGTASLAIGQDVSTLDGEYYSGRGRATFGSVSFKRVVPTG